MYSRLTTVSVFNRSITRSKRKTGGGGNDNNDNNEKAIAARIHASNVTMMNRAFYEQAEITHVAVMKAMTNRWGRPLKCQLVDHDSSKALRVVDQGFEDSDKKEVQDLVSFLNAYGIGAQFIDFLKYESTVRDPRFLKEYIISLNIPITGPRVVEWSL